MVLNYYYNMKDSNLSHLLRQSSIKTKNQLMVVSHSSWKDCPDTGISTGAYIIFYGGGPIDYGKYFPGIVYQSSA